MYIASRYSAVFCDKPTTTTSYKHIMFGRPMIKNIGVPSIFSHHVLGGRFHGISATGKGGQNSDRMFMELKIKGLEHPQCGCLTNHGGMDLKKEFAISLLNKHNIAVCTRSKN